MSLKAIAILVISILLILAYEIYKENSKTLGRNTISFKPLTPNEIVSIKDNEELFIRLGEELTRLIGPGESDDLDVFVNKIDQLPVGLKAMASTYQLDVSMTLDDLGWHFANWHHEEYAKRTLFGLRELGAIEEAELFEKAFQIAQNNWDFFARDDFTSAYHNSTLERSFDPLNDQFWRLIKIRGEEGISILDRWPIYARENPNKVCVSP